MTVETLGAAQRRENAEPHELDRPVPWGLLGLTLLMGAIGAAYIALADLTAPAEWGDGRVAAELSPPPRTAAADGAALFAARCAACHQAGGQGVPGVFPPLAGSEWVKGPPQVLAAIVLNGLQGPIRVRGADYAGSMPAFGGQLDDAEVAALLSHLRAQWGDGAGAVAPDTVAAMRRRLAATPGPLAGEAALGGLR